jgi:hypothetical protein
MDVHNGAYMRKGSKKKNRWLGLLYLPNLYFWTIAFRLNMQNVFVNRTDDS